MPETSAMVFEIPLRPLPGQMFMVVLGGQNCYFKLLSRRGHLYCGLTIDEKTIFNGLICHDRLPLKQSRLDSLSGTVVFVDTEGREDPWWEDLGTRFKFLYYGEGAASPGSFQTPIIDLD